MISVPPPLYSVVVTGCNDNAIRLMAEIRVVRPDWSPAEVKRRVRNLPQTLKEGLLLSDAKMLARRMRNVGGVVEVRDANDEFVYEDLFFEIKEPKPKPYPG